MNITIDPEQVFTSNIDLKKITTDINYSNNIFIRNNFINHNKHLKINEEKIINEFENEHIDHSCDIIYFNSVEKIKNSEYLRSILCSNDKDIIVDFVLENNLITFPSILSNSNQKVENIILEFIINNKKDIIINSSIKFLISMNTNSKIVDYLIENPKFIDLQLFAQNKNNKAVEYFIKNCNNDYITDFCLNKNPIAIKYCYNKYVDYSIENQELVELHK